MPGRADDCGRSILLALCAFAIGEAAGSAPARGADPNPPGYVRLGTWTETMRATRAAYLEWRKEHGGDPAPGATPFTSESIRGDGPGRAVSLSVAGCRWLRLISEVEEGNGNCHIWGEARLIAADGTETRLSALAPASIRVGWGNLLADRNWKDQPLKIGGRTFAHGIWVHANSDVSYLLDGRFERFEAWIGLDAARAEGRARFKVLFTGPDTLPLVWEAIAADFPAHAGWFREDSGGRQLDWFGGSADVRWIETLADRALRGLGREEAILRRSLDALRGAGAPVDDPRWLDLHIRTRRTRALHASLDRIWLVDLRKCLEADVDALLDPSVAPEDPRWDELASRVGRIAERIAAGRDADPEGIGSSIRSLAQAMPDRFAGADQRLEDMAARDRRRQDVIAGAARGEAAALDRLTAIADEIRTSRRSLVSSLRGMAEFLAVPANANLPAEWEREYEALRRDLGNRGHFARVAAETFRRDALILETDRDPADVVLRRTAALLADLRGRSDAPDLADLECEIEALRAASSRLDAKHTDARFVLFADACRLRRRITFRNPLLDFDGILLIKRHRALYDHMCDQYYGMAATPGGGLYVLTGAFGSAPRVRDVLSESLVERGRLRGEGLRGGPSSRPPLGFDGAGNLHGPDHEGGSFLSPDLSFDAKTILFAYVECRGDKRHRHHVDPARGHWDEGRAYHIFKVNVDGSGLEQLTDGTWNDFDPCFLPNGRIAFISERRGGYLRCGRVCPTYTLYDMAADGSDIACLSFHETNEWHPSVTDDGRIIWTRWDYVDRHGCTAHMPWITTLDGRDPRPVHGNYTPRNARPDMELDCRAVPNSHRFVATAAPHHGQAYGSLVIIDPHVADDDRMAPLKRITPEVGFPESQGGAEVYGTPWPLSDDYHLCVYDAGMQPGVDVRGSGIAPGTYGIYLVDSFGNKELIYRDPEIACLSPIPLAPRTMPPAPPEQVTRGPATNPAARPALVDDGVAREGTVAVINVYDALKPWPAGTRIRAIRVLQVLPMSVPSGGPPHETGLRVASAGDSVVPVRHVLGTVPVEEDGSAHFTVPADKEIFFQALDEEGFAVQSMRSATQLQAGERLVCAGCHELKHRVVQPRGAEPLALRRAPSRLDPDVDGSNPFSYPRLVQPVLDRRCVACHAKNPEKAPNLAREPIARGWYASYNSLIERYAFYDYGDAYRTTPGRFGARASKLYALLRDGHYDVALTAEEMHRIALWLDCASMFYGVYEREGGQAQLRGEIARPTLE